MPRASGTRRCSTIRARPSGALVYAGPDGAHLTDAQFERLKQELEENFSGAVNAGRPLLLEGGLDWKALSLSPKDMDFAETKASAAREIALAFGVPPLLIGLPGDNTFRNYEEANRAFWRQTIIPLVQRLQKAFHAWTQPGFAPFRLDYDADRIDALAQRARARMEPHRRRRLPHRGRAARGGGLWPDGQAREIFGGSAARRRRIARGRAVDERRRSGGGGDLAQVALNTIAGVVSDVGGLVTQIGDFIDLRDEEGESSGTCDCRACQEERRLSDTPCSRQPRSYRRDSVLGGLDRFLPLFGGGEQASELNDRAKSDTLSSKWREARSEEECRSKLGSERRQATNHICRICRTPGDTRDAKRARHYQV